MVYRQLERGLLDGFADDSFSRHRVQISTVLLVPLGVVILIRCRLGRNSRRLMPVTLVPTPPVPCRGL